MAGRFSVEAVFRAVDRMSGPVNKMSSASNRLTRGMRNDFTRAQRQAELMAGGMSRSFDQKLRRGAMVAMGGLALATGMAVREFAQFDNAVTKATAKFKDVNLATEDGKNKMKELRTAARSVGAVTQFSATEAGEGLDYLAMAGFSSAQAMKLLPGVVDLATVANTDLATATDIASDALGAFNLMTEDTEQLGKNLNRVMDVSAKTTTMFNTDLETLFESMKKGAPTFTAASQDIETFNALAGAMASAGVKGAESGTQLRNMMLRLAKPTGEAQKALSSLGVRTQDSNGDFRNAIDIIGDLERGLSGMGSKQRSATLTTIFGNRAVTGMNVLLSIGSDKLKEYQEALRASEGAARKMAEFMRGSLMNRLRILQSSAIELGFKFIEAFEKDGAGALEEFTKWIQNIDVKPIIAGMKTFVNVLRGVWDVIGPLVPSILAMVAAWTAYRKIMIAVAFIQTLVNTTNPLGWIMLIVGAVVALYHNWDEVVQFFKITIAELIVKWKMMKAVVYSFLEAIGLVSEKSLKAAVLDWKIAEGEAQLLKQGPVTQREAITDTQEKKETQEIIIRNESGNQVETKGRAVIKGTSLRLPQSGGIMDFSW